MEAQVLKIVEGQLVQVSYKGTETENPYWMYGVITDIFDSQFCITTEHGRRIMHHVNNDGGGYAIPECYMATDVVVTPLFRYDQPVKVGKSFLYKYKFPSR